MGISIYQRKEKRNFRENKYLKITFNHTSEISSILNKVIEFGETGLNSWILNQKYFHSLLSFMGVIYFFFILLSLSKRILLTYP